MAHARQSRPDYGLTFEVLHALQTLSVVQSSLGSGRVKGGFNFDINGGGKEGCRMKGGSSGLRNHSRGYDCRVQGARYRVEGGGCTVHGAGSVFGIDGGGQGRCRV